MSSELREDGHAGVDYGPVSLGDIDFSKLPKDSKLVFTIDELNQWAYKKAVGALPEERLQAQNQATVAAYEFRHGYNHVIKEAKANMKKEFNIESPRETVEKIAKQIKPALERLADE